MTEEQLTPTVAAELRDEAQGQLDATVALRRTLARVARGRQRAAGHPGARCSAALEGLPLDVTVHETTSGIAALLTGGKPGPTILLRGDMDALPLHEDTGLDFASQPRRPDARLRARHPHGDARRRRQAARRRAGELAGRVLFMFQPGEEGHHGARFMLDEGLLDVPAARRRHAVAGHRRVRPAHHVVAADRAGSACRGGPTMASADTLLITITGKGGHASEPHRAVDPIPVACEIVQALQTMVTRTVDVFDPARRHRRPDHRRHDEQHHPRDGRDRGHDPRRQRADPRQGARRHPPRRRRHRRRPRRAGEVEIEPATRSRSTTATFADFALARRRATSSAPTTSSRCRTRSWAPRTSATCCSGCPGR